MTDRGITTTIRASDTSFSKLPSFPVCTEEVRINLRPDRRKRHDQGMECLIVINIHLPSGAIGLDGCMLLEYRYPVCCINLVVSQYHMHELEWLFTYIHTAVYWLSQYIYYIWEICLSQYHGCRQHYVVIDWGYTQHNAGAQLEYRFTV